MKNLWAQSQDLSHVLAPSLAVVWPWNMGLSFILLIRSWGSEGIKDLDEAVDRLFQRLLVLALPLTGARVNLSGIIIYENVNCCSRTMPNMSWDSLFRFMVMMMSLISILSVVQLLVYVYPQKWWRQASFRVLQGSLCRACLEHCVGRILVPVLSSSYHYWLLVQNNVAIPETEGGGELLLP